MKYFLAISILAFVLASCEKDRIPEGYHVQMNVDGKQTTVAACGSSAYYAEFLKDTALFIGVQCGGQGIGFYLRGHITDGTYELNQENQGTYFYLESVYKFYKTNSAQKGSLTISSERYNNQPALKGQFEFNAIDTVTGRVLRITDGSFLLEKHHY